ncbi:MAG TPA: tRNA pseudouridine synthase A [Elusimicrobiota bacterium]|nr:tRNA pseudouridine synthase A [Elusimicrobiota bacterium]
MRKSIVYKLVLEYDGTRFSGWQFQPGRRTVQGELEKALRVLFRKRVSAVGASRTDSGVHAMGQVASLRAPGLFHGRLAAALNAHLPSDVSVLSAERAPSSFHARRDAVEKTYVYRLLARAERPALMRTRAAWLARPLRSGLLRREAERIRRRRNFAAFAGRAGRDRSPLCRLSRLVARKRGDETIFEISGDRFLHRMVRRIVGQLIAAGLGKTRPDPRQTVPPHGLYLKSVRY